MASERDEGEPVAGQVELRRDRRRDGVVAAGTLACPACDAPVAPGGRLGLTDPLRCPFCGHAAPVRDFLTLGAPGRPARVVVRVRAAP